MIIHCLTTQKGQAKSANGSGRTPDFSWRHMVDEVCVDKLRFRNSSSLFLSVALWSVAVRLRSSESNPDQTLTGSEWTMFPIAVEGQFHI